MSGKSHSGSETAKETGRKKRLELKELVFYFILTSILEQIDNSEKFCCMEFALNGTKAFDLY